VVNTYSVSREFKWAGEISERAAAVMRMFGVSIERLKKQTFTHSCSLEIGEGDIVFLTGPSGAGKSVLLRELEKAVPKNERINLDDIELADDKTLIDCVGGDIVEGLQMLSLAGLNDVFCILNQPAKLSAGQQWRFRLAMAMAAGRKCIFADEFCSNLDRITAAVVSYNVHKFAKRNKVTFILAGSNDDVLGDLAPDVIVEKPMSGEAETIYKKWKR